MKPKRKTPSPRSRLVDILCEFGFTVCEDDISWVRGAWSHVHFDVTHRWTANVVRVSDSKKVEITGTDTIKDCVKYGITLEANGADSDYYGDYVASPKYPINKGNTS